MSLHIIVCIKAVVAQAPKGRMIRTEENIRLNPFDLPALEAALQIKAQHGGMVTALSMGPPPVKMIMTEAMAMGVDRAVLACDGALAGGDTLATATTLAAAIRKISPFDLLFFGTRTSDSDTGQVGPQAAVDLDIPLVTGVHQFEVQKNGEKLKSIRVERTMDHLVESFEVDFPAALTLRPEAAPPRDIGLAGLAEAFDLRQVEIMNLSDLGLEPGQVGETGSPTRVLSMKPIHHERRCRMIEGESGEIADQLIHHLMNQGLME